jgi:hypothetical protein
MGRSPNDVLADLQVRRPISRPMNKCESCDGGLELCLTTAHHAEGLGGVSHTQSNVADHGSITVTVTIIVTVTFRRSVSRSGKYGHRGRERARKPCCAIFSPVKLSGLRLPDTNSGLAPALERGNLSARKMSCRRTTTQSGHGMSTFHQGRRPCTYEDARVFVMCLWSDSEHRRGLAGCISSHDGGDGGGSGSGAAASPPPHLAGFPHPSPETRDRGRKSALPSGAGAQLGCNRTFRFRRVRSQRTRAGLPGRQRTRHTPPP